MAVGPKPERLSGASDPSARLFVDAVSLRVSAATMTVVMVLSPVVAFAQSVPAGVANIVPDGRTATAVTTNGAVSTVTTNTVSGPNAFNSFSRFQVGRGATGNLILPQGTSNLVNLINGNDPAVINGVVNSYKNGQIGGNVYFASPNGFVVGSSGVVNVGSLNVSTPTREFVDGVIGRNGQINQGAVDNLLAGTVPLSPEGNIRIRGRVNAVDAVRLTGQNVSVGARDAANRNHAAAFASTVNSKGLRSGSKIVVRNGSIQIVAGNDARINGRLRAKGGSVHVDAHRNVAIGNKANISVSSRDGHGGTIAVNAGQDIKVAGYGVLSAKSVKADAGTVRVVAGRNLSVDPGATFNASSAQGNGGLVELSGYGRVNIPSGVKVNVGAPNGRAGYFLIDPPDISISSTATGAAGSYSNAEVKGWVDALGSNGTLVLCAGSSSGNCNGTFTLASDGVIDGRRTGGVVGVAIDAGTININGTIDTRLYAGALRNDLLSASGALSTGSSGSVTLTAPTISIGSTGKIFADVNNATGAGATSYTGGAIALTATARDLQAQLPSNAATAITIEGTLAGRTISAIANSEASTVFSNSTLGMSQFVAGAFGGILAGISGGYVKSEASAKVTVEGTAHLTATGAVMLSSIGSVTAQDPAVTASLAALQNAVAASVVVGVVNADIATQVKSGAHISSGDLSVLASNQADLSAKSVVFTSTTAYDGTFAYSTGTVNTRATLDPGVVIEKVGNVTVAAQNTNSYSTSATSVSAGVGRAAVAVAISDVTNHAVANLGASVPAAAGAGTVNVYSGSNTTSNSVSASSTVGSNFIVTNVLSAIGSMSTSVGSLFAPGGPFDSSRLYSSTTAQGTTATMRAGITLALNFASLSSSASIAALAPDTQGDMRASGAAPAVVGSGNVSVISALTDAGLRGNAESSIASNVVGTEARPTTGSAASMAVNVVQVTQSSDAFVGSGASVSGSHIGVKADATTPITITWLDWDSFSAVTSHISGSFGVVSNILTSYANATADSASLGISGAVNYFDVTTNTTAWVASGATLTQTGSSSCVSASGTCWSTALPASLAGAPDPYAWTKDIQVAATTTNASINVGGNFSWLKLFGTNSTSTEGTAIGGSANVNIFHSNTVAGIGADATVTSIGKLAVTAKTSDLIYAVAPTSGKGSGLGLNGMASILEIDNTTSASISNLAQISASFVAVNAEQDISSFNVAGGVGSAAATGVGMVAALVSTSLNTKAFVGDNSMELAVTGATANDSNMTRTVTAGLSAFDLAVTALTVGRMTTVSVAAQSANNVPDPTETPEFIKTAPPNADYLTKAASFFVDAGIALLLKTTVAINNLTDDVSGPVNGGNVVAGAGSASVDLTSVATAAWIAGASVGYAPGGNNHVTVQALNNTIVDTASGAAALSKGAPGTDYNVALAGAVAVTTSNNLTTAKIWQSTISANQTTVQALAGGESTTLGLAVAVAAGSANSSVQAAASASVAQITDGVQANIDSSMITSNASYSSGDIGIFADQQTKIGIGAGSLYAGFVSVPDPSKSVGVGVSMTYAFIGDPSNGAAVSAVLSNSKVDQTNSLTIEALNSSRILSGAAVAGGGIGANGFSGSVVVNDISPTIIAEITSIPSDSSRATVTGGITVAGDVIVNASGGSLVALDTLIANAQIASNGGLSTTGNSGLQFSGGVLQPSSATGAAILAVAGNVGIGAANIGVSIVVNRIGTRHLALIDGASLTSTGGVVKLSAVEEAEIVGVAVGFGGATGKVAGNGSIAYNAINNVVVAQIGHGITVGDPAQATATVDAAAVSVTAQDNATIRGAAGAIAANIGGADAVGLSAAVSQIGTYVSAAISGATVTADNTLSNNSSLIAGNLGAGSVVVSGSSTADITSIAIGVAVSVGNNNSPSASPQSNLSSLVASMRPGSPSGLTGFGGGGITPPTPPPAAAPPPSVPSNGLAGAGSLALSMESTTVYSAIADGGDGRGSTVTANNNALVLAANADTIGAYAGALALSFNSGKGMGASVVVNTVGGTTSAKVSNSTVDAHARGNAATIDSGALNSSPDPTDAVTPGSAPSLANDTTTIKGVAAISTSQQSANTVAVVAAASSNGLALSANAVTNVMGGLTEAQIQTASINTHLAAGEDSAVRVTASSASFVNNLDLGLSDSGSGTSGTVALVINTMDRTTNAKVLSTDIGSSSAAAGAVFIHANAFQATAGEAIGGAGSGGGTGVAGSALTNLFTSETTAWLDHGTTYADSLAVRADGKNGFFAAVGAGAIGSSAGIGATVLVAMSNNTVTARVGDRDASSGATTLNLGGALTVRATNETDTNSYVVVGAIGGTAGIAAQFSGTFVANTVNAELDNTITTITTSTPTDGTVTVAAQETDSIAPVVGALAGGGSIGFGAAVNLVQLKSSTASQIAGGTVTTPGQVNVSALSTRDVNPITLVAGLSGQVGIAGTVGVVIIGDRANSDQMSVLNAGATSSDSNSGTLGNAGAATGTDVIGQVDGGVDGISAQILNATVNAGAIGVVATAQTAVRNIAGAVAVGVGVGGAGAGVALTTVEQQVTAKTSGGQLNAPVVYISAAAGDHGSGHTAEADGIAGAGGFYVGLGAAVGQSHVDNTVLAELGSRIDGGTVGAATGSVSVLASDTSTAVASGYGFGGGIGAIGLSLGIVDKSSSVTADVVPSTTVDNVFAVMVMASAAGSLRASSLAGAAGIISGAGATATATDSETVVANVGAGSTITTTGTGVLVNATATPDVGAESIGTAAGSVGIGSSVATSKASVRVSSYVDDNTIINGGSLTVTASALVPITGHSTSGEPIYGHSTYAKAVGSGGGLLMGLQATDAEADNTSSVRAYGGKNLHLPTADVTIAAENDTNQYAESLGVAGGYNAAGASLAQTSSTATTHAWLDVGAVTAVSNLGVLSITATGSDSNTAKATAGSGGLSAGAAAVATTSTTSTTDAVLDGGDTDNTLYFGGLGINAQHTATYAANGDAFQASAIGASGGVASNTVDSTVAATVGTHLIVNSAGGNMNVIASDSVNQTSGGARSGSGGAAAAGAAVSETTVTQNVTTNIGADTILSLNDNPATSTALINIEAYNFLDTTDSVSLVAGGLFAGGGARSTMDATANVTVNIADRVHLFSAGNIAIGTAARMTASSNASASLYGLLAGVGARTNATQNAHQNVNVGAATIEAWGLINVYAGQSGDNSYTSSIKSNGTTVVYNYTAIPISAEYRGTAVANSYATLTLDTGSRVLGANNIFLGSTPGATAANGSGTNYNPYLSAFSTASYQNDGRTPITSGDAILNGTIVAGIHNQEIITISYGGTVTLSSGGSPYGLTLEQIGESDHFSSVMSYNHQAVQYKLLGVFNPKQDAYNQIADMSGQTASQVSAAIAAGQPITALNDDAAGTKQRMIDTLIQQMPYLADQAGAAYAFGDILASAGNVSILASHVSGTAAVTARNAPLISFDNQGTKFLFTSALALSGVTGGRVDFTGDGREQGSGLTITRDLSSWTPTIQLMASYNAVNANRQPIDQQGNLLLTTPDIYFGGVVTNVNGILNVNNQLGNVLITRDIRAGTVVMTVPEGLIGGNLGANSVYNTNFDVAAQWSGPNLEYRPTDVLTAVYAAATYLGMYGQGDGRLAIGGNGGMFPYYYYTNQQGYSGTASTVTDFGGSASTIFTARMLAAFYDGAHNNSPSLYSWIFLPVGEGVTPSSGGTAASWVRNQYLNQAYSGDSGPFNYANGGNFFQVVQIQNQVVNGVHLDSAPNASNPTIYAGKALILSASAININGRIEVGQSSNYSVDIGDTAKAIIQDIKDHADKLAQAQSAAAAGRYVDLKDAVTVVNGTDVKVMAKYNALTDQILLDPVVQGTGGYVYLNGRILSTSTSGGPMGNIIVHGGAGTVTVNNTTGTALVTNIINTGISAASVVEFVDHARDLTTWYVYNAGAPAGQQVAKYEASGVNVGSYIGLTPTYSANSGLTYRTADQLYQWVDTASLSRASTSDMSVFGWHFDNISSANSAIYPYARSAPQVVNGTQTYNFQESISATGDYTEYQINTTADKLYGSDFHGTWFRERFEHVTLTMTNSVKANFPIDISFTGGGTSNIAVTSNASVIVNASINNLQGNTSITATGANSAIVAGATPFISGVSVTLNGEGGVGSLDKPLPIATYGGTFSASSVDHDIAVAAVGNLTLTQVKANPAVAGNPSQGNILISATGDINAASSYNASSPTIVGKSITINATGAIGAVSAVSNGQAVLNNINPIVIQASATRLADGTYDGGILNSASSSGTYLMQATGDLRIGLVTSNGPVFLSAATGSILNGLTTQGLTTAQTTYLQNVWSQLNLLGSGGGTPGSVAAYQVVVNAAYNDYWQLRNLAFYDGTNYSATTAVTTLDPATIASQIAARLNVPVTAVTDQQIQAEIAVRSDAIKAQMAAKLGVAVTAITDAQFKAEVANRDLGRSVIAAQLAAKTGANVSSITDDQVLLEASTRFLKAQYLLGIRAVADFPTSLPGSDANASPVSLATLFGASTQQAALYQVDQTQALHDVLATNSYDSTFRFVLPQTSALYQKLASGSQWTLDQLTYTVSPGANPENNVPATPVSLMELNVRGQQVMLYAPHGTIGSLATPEVFTFRSDDASNLTAAQKALLASAGPGQLTVQVGDVAGSNGTIKQYTVTIAQQSLVVIDPYGPVSALAQSQIYLGSRTNLLLGGIPISAYGPMTAAYAAGVQTIQSGDVRLQAGQSILGGIPNQVAISGNIANLTLIADAGSIGQASNQDPASNPNALLLALTGANSQLDQVKATQGIYIRQTAGDLVVGNINAGSGSDSALQLGATGSIYAESQFTDRSVVHIVATSLDVRAGGSVSFNQGNYQPLQVKITGAITGLAADAMTLFSPNASMTIGRAGDYGTLVAGGALTLDTVGDLTIAANTTAGGSLQLLANGTVMFSAGTSTAPIVASSSTAGVTLAAAALSMGAFTDIDAAGAIVIATTGDATLGRLTSSLAFASAGNAISVTAGGLTSLGAVLSNGDGRANLSVTGANAAVWLAASGDIGSETDRLILATAMASIQSMRGDVFLSSLGTLHVASGTATLGAFSLIGTAVLTLDTVNAGTRIDVRSAGGAVALGIATSGGSQTIRAASDVTFTSLTALGIAGDAGNIGVTADTGAIQGGTVLANGFATLTAATSNKGISATATTGSLTMASSLIDWGVLSAGTSIEVSAAGEINLTTTTSGATTNIRSIGGAVALGTATSGGSQTIRAASDLTFASLTANGVVGDVGNIEVTADAGAIQGGTVAANGSVTLTAATDNKGAGATATTGSLMLASIGAIDWGALNAGTSIDALATGAVNLTTMTSGTTTDLRSTGGAINLGTATSGGSQTIRAASDVLFGQLTANGISGDIGDVTVTADSGAIQGGAVAANGSVTLTATTDNKGASAAATMGSLTMAGSLIDWGALNAGTSIGVHAVGGVNLTTTTSGTTTEVRSTGGAVALGTATSGGSQMIWAATDVTFARLAANGITGDVGNISATADAGAIHGDTVAANGSATLTAGTSSKGIGATATTGSLTLASGGPIDWHTLTAGTSIEAGATGAVNLATTNSGTTTNISSTGAAVNLGTTTSGGSQTIRAASDVIFDQLTAKGISGDIGDVTVIADSGAIQGDTVAANGSGTLTAAAGNKGTSATATTGSLTIAGSLIDWGILNAGTSIDARATGAVKFARAISGTTMNVRSTGNAVALDTATSGGSQTIRAANDVIFGQLTANGVSGDVGNISVTADNGAIQGRTVAANGSVTLAAATDNKGTRATATTGSLMVASAGVIDWGALNAGTSIDVLATGAVNLTATTSGTTTNISSTGGAVTLGTTTSGGSQMIRAANDVTFGQLTVNGISSDTGAVTVTADSGAIQGGTVAANGSATLTAATSNKGIHATSATGSMILASASVIDWNTLNAGTSIEAAATGGVNLTTTTSGTTTEVRSTGGAVTLGTTTSGGSQTIWAATDVAFAGLTANGIAGDVGNISVTADTGAVQGGVVAAHGSAALTAATNNKGNGATATVGSLTLASAGPIGWSALNAGTQIDVRATGPVNLATITSGTTTEVRSTGGAVDLGTTISGGSQTIRAASDVNFAALKANGAGGDPGDMTVTADNGAIQGGVVVAHGSATLTAATNNIGDTLTATTGDISLRAGGLIDWNMVKAGRAILAESTGGSIRFGVAVSGGNQTLQAYNDIAFGRLEATGSASDPANIDLRAMIGQVQGSDIVTRGDVSLAGSTDLTLQTLQGASVSLTAPHDISVAQLNVFRSLTLVAGNIRGAVTQLPSVPAVPLHVTLTGFNGGVATSANLSLDSPNVVIDRYKAVDSVLTANASRLTIVDGYVPGQMMLNTSAWQILMNNRSPVPIGNVDLQLYQPDGIFAMSQIGNTNLSNTYVVRYGTTVSSVITNYGGGDFGGTSFVRNAIEDMRNAGAFDPADEKKGGLATFYLLGQQALGFRDHPVLPIEVLGHGPAINLKGLFDGRRPAKKRRQQARVTGTKRHHGDARFALGLQ
ncbi:MAG: leukotoxin LktA family filamentous adhesin [Rhizobiales bacterium]|nr:leukotoxin LktA family filamentous adhesin [Hyphomicrobiales bacterium]